MFCEEIIMKMKVVDNTSNYFTKLNYYTEFGFIHSEVSQMYE